MDFSLVVRISKNAFPSVHLSKFQIEIQHVHIESYTENGLFLFYCLFLAEEFRLVPTKVYDCFADVVMWFPPILSRVEYPNWPQQSGPFSAGQTARSTPCTPAASYAWRSRLQALHIAGCGQPVLLWPYHSYWVQRKAWSLTALRAWQCAYGRREWPRASPLLESIQKSNATWCWVMWHRKNVCIATVCSFDSVRLNFASYKTGPGEACRNAATWRTGWSRCRNWAETGRGIALLWLGTRMVMRKVVILNMGLMTHNWILPLLLVR